MKVRVGGRVRRGRAIDLRAGTVWEGRAIDLREFDGFAHGDVPSALADLIRGKDATCGGDLTRDEDAASDVGFDAAPVSIDCPTPGPVHEHVGVIRPGMDVPLRAALAAAARSRGHGAPQAEELATVRERLDALTVDEIDLESARRRVADATEAAAELRERVAALRGRVQALREVSDGREGSDGSEGSDGREVGDSSVADAEAELAEATRRLSEVDTERIAAEQALAHARKRANSNRAARRERLRLQDRADNLRRAAREHLAEIVRESFVDAREALPGGADSGEPVEKALAVARVAELEAPVVLARDADPFDDVETAARWLDGPVLRV